MCLEEHEAVTDECKISEELSQKLHKVETSEKISQLFEEKTVIVKEGEDLTLNTDVEVQTDDQILWTFGARETHIAEIRGVRETYDGADGRFRDRLKLDKKTGSLTITNITAEHIGVYKLQTISSRGTLYQRFIITVCFEEKTVIVKEGEDLTLNTDVKVQTDDQILWTFGARETHIADIREGVRETYDGADGRFRDRLKLDETTGFLTITNITAEHIGVYKLQTISNRGTLYQRFIVTVRLEEKTVIVKEGEDLTLNTDVKVQTDYQILWTFGARETHIADIRGVRETYDGSDGRFRDRLKLDKKTGSLTITNITAEHIGVYKLQTISNRGTLYQRFIVTVRLEEKTVIVKEGEDLTLNTDVKVQTDDQILWTFGPQETHIAEIRGEARETFDGSDGRFRDRLKLEKTTGFLTITNFTAEHIGVYKLQAISSRGTLYQIFIITVREETILKMEEESVTLYPDTEVQKDDLILWMFGDQDNLIAQMMGKTREKHDVADRRFRDRLKLDKKTGSLTISNTTVEHSGPYKLQISSSRGTSYKKFKVVIHVKKVSALEGEDVTLKIDDEKQKNDQILWLFGDKDALIAEISGGTEEIITYDVADGRFRDRLVLDKKTGSLTITNTTKDLAGLYKLKRHRGKEAMIKRFFISVRARMILGKEEKNVTLNPDTEVQRDELILWMFGDQDNLIAQLIGETGETTYADADERFRDKLRLNKNTGALTISNITSGPYNLQIISSKRTSYRNFRVFKCCESGPKTVSVMAGECLVLITDFKVVRDEKVEWRFEDKILKTGMNGDISKTSYGADVRFRGRLELHHQTGSLTIKDTRTSDTGVYHLNICSGKNICWEFSVTVSGSDGKAPGNEPKQIPLETD
ncbi:hypothetical protein PO909_028014 [Leuciscus waleckii]